MPEPAFPTLVPSVYPATLPNPSVSNVTPAHRVDSSDVSGGPEQVRSRQRDYLALQDIEWPPLPADQAITLDAWWNDTLTRGGAWFTSTWPAPQGWVGLTRRFEGVLRWSYIPGGFWRVTARCQVRGRGTPPLVLGCVPWVQAQACPPVGVPNVFGAGIYSAVDPLTGYIWATWRSAVGGSIPTGGSASLDGSYVLVYDPLAMTLLTSIRLGPPDSDFICILYRAGYFYTGVTGNSFNAAGATPVVTQINAATRAIVASGATSYPGAVSKIGLLSQDASGLYISASGGAGAGTAAMASASPFSVGPFDANSTLLFNAVWNPFSGARAYTGTGAVIDLRGPAATSITITSWGVTQATRLVYKTCTPYIYAMDIGASGVYMVQTLTGEISTVSATLWPRAMYYSPESGILYVDGSETQFGATTVTSFNGSTFQVLATYPTYAVAQGLQFGNAIYLGCESFVACESTSGPGARMWRVGFPR